MSDSVDELKEELSTTTLGEIRQAFEPAFDMTKAALADGSIDADERRAILGAAFAPFLELATVYVEHTPSGSDDIALAVLKRFLPVPTEA